MCLPKTSITKHLQLACRRLPELRRNTPRRVDTLLPRGRDVEGIGRGSLLFSWAMANSRKPVSSSARWAQQQVLHRSIARSFFCPRRYRKVVGTLRPVVDESTFRIFRISPLIRCSCGKLVGKSNATKQTGWKVWIQGDVL